MKALEIIKKLKDKFLKPYHIIFFDARTMQERFSIKLNRSVLFLSLFPIVIVCVILTTLLIAYTSLREYIPGYVADFETQENKIKKLAYTSDSFSVELENYKLYVKNIDDILNGRVQKADLQKVVTPPDSIGHINKIDLNATERDSAFRLEIEKEDRWNFEQTNRVPELVLFKPVNGIITGEFDVANEHFAIDLACRKGEPIKAVADGTVIFADWTSSTGYVIILFHKNNMMSVYKHNSELYKEIGELVKAGEVIATAGSEGELSTGPHLHFELWLNGIPVDPSNYLDFS